MEAQERRNDIKFRRPDSDPLHKPTAGQCLTPYYIGKPINGERIFDVEWSSELGEPVTAHEFC